MLTLQKLPRWQIKRPVKALQHSGRSTRAQHGNHTQPSPTAHITPDPIQVLRAQAPSTGSSSSPWKARVQLILGGIFCAALFGGTGFVASWGYKTWSYLHVGQLIPLPERQQRIKTKLASKLEEAALVRSLLEEGWVEDNPLKQEYAIEDIAQKTLNKVPSHHLVNENLVDRGYLLTRHFRHPTDSITLVVFVASYGCESWPDVLHGGIATLVIQDALDAHVKQFQEYAPIRSRETMMNYRRPLQPGKVYTALVNTEVAQYPFDKPEKQDKGFLNATVNVSISEMDQTPRIVSREKNSFTKDMVVCQKPSSPERAPAVIGRAVLYLAYKHFNEAKTKDKKTWALFVKNRDIWLKDIQSQQTANQPLPVK